MNRECPDLAVWSGPFAVRMRRRTLFTRFTSFVYRKDRIQLVLQQCLVCFCSPEIWTLPMKLCLHMQLWTAKAKIRLRWCAVWSGPSLPTFKIDCIKWEQNFRCEQTKQDDLNLLILIIVEDTFLIDVALVVHGSLDEQKGTPIRALTVRVH